MDRVDSSTGVILKNQRNLKQGGDSQIQRGRVSQINKIIIQDK
jgi:hypothetical protein